jgi:hypothetical protein
MGVGGHHAAIMATFLDLPEPHKWNWPFNVIEKFTPEAIKKVKEISQSISVQEEVLETVSQESNAMLIGELKKKVLDSIVKGKQTKQLIFDREPGIVPNEVLKA